MGNDQARNTFSADSLLKCVSIAKEPTMGSAKNLKTVPSKPDLVDMIVENKSINED